MQNERLTANAGGLLLFWLFNCARKTFLNRLYKECLEAEKIAPIIDRIVLLNNIQKDFDYSESGRAKGKVIIKIK